MRALYPLLHPLLSRAPWPYRGVFEVHPRAPGLTSIRMARAYFGRSLLSVHVYAVGDTFVDAGLACLSGPLLAHAREARIRQAIVTHHHEDHAGGAAALGEAGLRVRGAAATAAVVRGEVPICFYEHLAWGRMPPARLEPLSGPVVALGRHEAQVVPAPGHCEDQIALHVPAEGWLFSGDVFIHERVRIFRRDEDFARTVDTLVRLLRLDFDALWCAHRPRPTGGKAALAAKLQWLREVEGEVRAGHARGDSIGRIAARLAGFDKWRLITAGDASARNLVRSVLFGPTPRPEIHARRVDPGSTA